MFIIFFSFQSLIESLLLRTYTGQFQLARKIDHEFIDQILANDTANREEWVLRADRPDLVECGSATQAPAPATPPTTEGEKPQEHTEVVAQPEKVDTIAQRHRDLVIEGLTGWIARSYKQQKSDLGVEFSHAFTHHIELGPCEGKLI